MSDAEDWDFDLQRAQTEYTVADLLSRTPLKGGETIVLDLEFAPTPAADPEAVARKLAMFGYAVAAEPSEEGNIRVEVPGVSFDVDSIWTHEERTTKLALLHGYEPDGWGFWEP